jgi:lipopolysaccharide heptosyltransferase II
MKILLVEPNWLGDVILTTPAFSALKDKFPNAFISCALPKRCKDVLTHNPYIDEIIEFDERKQTKSLVAKIKFVSAIKKERYDAVILFHRSFTRALLFSLAGIPQRIGYAYKKRSYLLTQKVKPLNKDQVHKQDYYLGILEGFDLTIKDKSCRVYVSDEERAQAKALIGETKASPLIAINPFTNWQPKNWPIEYFKEFIDLVTQSRPQAKFLITSAKDDPLLAQLLSANVINLAGKTNLRQLIALYEQMDLVVSGDSGPLHFPQP